MSSNYNKIHDFYLLQKIYMFNPHVVDYDIVPSYNKDKKELIFYVKKPNNLQKINEAILLLSLNSV